MLEKSEFVRLIQEIGIQTQIFTEVATLINVELGMTPKDRKHELHIIKTLMGGCLDFKEYLKRQLKD